ncbi:helix-turn-helix domain-containing protein [Sphingobacterium bovistauri]|uniref:Helix-turn-helix transcriptional regulator n=1 Tax=Sphingobacterium bovistauri TaxID=2781959 RepID=A0ABS7Z4E5_9SPHI|nr:helix-turn-helix transcriptional regulator [Sphingobacterium bovistauri]MCA5004427.1 helix-turn-helix transcriptional regulator [Sphingobacterium bovistauri]
MSQIGNNIKKLRKVKGLSQQAFADMFNLTRGNISSYEEFRAEPKIAVVLHIAKYFSIPVAELLENQLTVNEILNFEDHFDQTSIKLDSKNLTELPLLNREYLQNSDKVDIKELPNIYFPIYTKHKMLAVEVTNLIPHLVDFPYVEGSVLFFEHVEIDILHTLDTKIGFYLNQNDLFFGSYSVEDKEIKLKLNDWKEETFTQENRQYFWKLYAQFSRV